MFFYIVRIIIRLGQEQQKRIEDLEEKLRTNSDNSSKPPSSNIFKSQKKKKKKGKRNRGGQPGHAGMTRELLPEEEVDHIEHHLPTGHCSCGGHVKTIRRYRSDYKMSKRDVTRLLGDVYSLSICIATVKRAEETVSEAIAAPVEEAKAYVKAQKIVNCDER